MDHLKRLFGLREMAVNVPDKDVAGLKRAIKAAVNSKILPPEANQWIPEKPGAASSAPVAKAAATAKKDPGYDPKVATRTKKEPTKQSNADLGLDDDWFADDDALGGAGPSSVKPKKRAEPEPEDEEPSDDDFPTFTGSQAFQSQNAPALTKGPQGDDVPSFNANLYGSGHSSWDDVPDWMRDPEKMPGQGRTSMSIPRNQGPADDDVGDVPGKLPKAKKQAKGKFNPVGKPWTDDPLEPKKPGLLGRLFGRNKK